MNRNTKFDKFWIWVMAAILAYDVVFVAISGEATRFLYFASLLLAGVFGSSLRLYLQNRALEKRVKEWQTDNRIP